MFTDFDELDEYRAHRARHNHVIVFRNHSIFFIGKENVHPDGSRDLFIATVLDEQTFNFSYYSQLLSVKLKREKLRAAEMFVRAKRSEPITNFVEEQARDQRLKRAQEETRLSMIGVFSIDKMEQYAVEAREVFLPMLKKAGKMFPEQLQAYHAISQRMKKTIEFVDAYVALARS